MVTAFVAIKPFDPSQADDAPDRLQHIEEIISCYSVAGEPSYLLKVQVPDHGAPGVAAGPDPGRRQGVHPHHHGAVHPVRGPARRSDARLDFLDCSCSSSGAACTRLARSRGHAVRGRGASISFVGDDEAARRSAPGTSGDRSSAAGWSHRPSSMPTCIAVQTGPGDGRSRPARRAQPSDAARPDRGVRRRRPEAAVIIGQGWDERELARPAAADARRAGPGAGWRPARLPGPGRRALGGGLHRRCSTDCPAIEAARLPLRRAAQPRRAPPRVAAWSRPAVHRRRPPIGGSRGAADGRRPGRRHGARAGRSTPRAARGPGPGTRGGGRPRPGRGHATGASWPPRSRSTGRAQPGPRDSPATCASTGRSAPGPPR